jgi:HAD superfamily hydrolase (TIGR01509 family)
MSPRRASIGPSVPDNGGSEGSEPVALAAVLFDMDGTLIDSEKLWSIALEEVARELGGELSAETRLAMVGTDLVGSVRMLHADIGYDGDIDVSRRLLVSAAARQFDGPLEWRPGARELLLAVRKAGLSTALVTSTHRNLVAKALETLGRDRFDVIVCGDDVSRTKPDPEPYVRALAELGVPARTAIAIEDSPAGSSSARAAGIPVLVVPSELAVEPVQGMLLLPTLAGVGVPELATIARALAKPGQTSTRSRR